MLTFGSRAVDLLSIDLVRNDGTATLVLAGEIDLSNREALADALEKALESPNVVVDLSRVRYLDSSGLRVLMTAHERARQDGGSLTVTRPSKDVRRVLELTSVLSLLTNGAESDEPV